MNDPRTAVEKTLVNLLQEIANDLLRKVKEGEATHQDISNAIKLLQNNGITVEVKKGKPLAILSETLPFESDRLVSQ